MNRRGLIAGVAALAASSVVPISLSVARPHPTAAAYEFARRVMGLPAEDQALFAAMLRAVPGRDPLLTQLAEVIEDLAQQNGWVKGEQYGV